MSTAAVAGAPQFPAAAEPLAPSTRAAMDGAVSALESRKDAWVATPARDRVAILERLTADFSGLADRWVAACLAGKRVSADSPAAGEEWIAGAVPVLRILRQLRRSLADIASGRAPRVPGKVRSGPEGQLVAPVFPENLYDRLLFGGLRAEVWMEPDVPGEELAETQAVVYRDRSRRGRVALVLGAGNVSSIAPTDVLYKLFVEDQVVLLKTNPVNAYLGPLIEEAFRALIEPGFLRVVRGGAAEGSYLCGHPGVEEIHVTGSDKTFDAIVFGSGAEGAARKAERRPLLDKRVTGELGNVSPVIVVPGPWSDGDIDYHADHLAAMIANNAGFNCNTTRVIVQHSAWPLRERLLRRMAEILRSVPARAAYYPGASDRFRVFLDAHPDAERIGTGDGGTLPWTLIRNVAPDSDDICFTTEAFCSLCAETQLPARDAAEFVDRAVEFVNNRVWGTLNATLLVHPRSLRDRALAAAVERAVAGLRYGTVGLNYWAGAGFVLGTTTWGAFPGHPLHDIRSGTGVVHNTLMFARAQKSVLRAPFRIVPRPPWFATRGGVAARVFRRMADFEAAPSPWKVPGIVTAALP